MRQTKRNYEFNGFLLVLFFSIHNSFRKIELCRMKQSESTASLI